MLDSELTTSPIIPSVLSDLIIIVRYHYSYDSLGGGLPRHPPGVRGFRNRQLTTALRLAEDFKAVL